MSETIACMHNTAATIVAPLTLCQSGILSSVKLKHFYTAVVF